MAYRPAWPLGYEEFEPWYAKAEWLYQVRGLHGEDPSEGSWSEEYPWPPISHEPLIQQIADDLDRAGYYPFHIPRGIMLNEANPPTSLCIRCGKCDGYPCMVHAKADADIIAVRPLLSRLNVTLLVNAEVRRLETDPRGQVGYQGHRPPRRRPRGVQRRHRGPGRRGGQLRQGAAPVGI